MDVGSLTSGLLTGLREGVEAALIISIILSYLARTGNRRAFGRVWLGTAAAMLVSVAAGVTLFVTVGVLPSPYEQLFEAGAMLLAAGVVTWMLFWMRRTSAGIRDQLQVALGRALSDGTATGLAVLAFVSVIREGLETALFLVGQAASAQAGAAGVLVGALAGLLIASAIGAAMYRGAARINLRSFFRWTGIALIFIAAGLLASAIHELLEIGWIGVGTIPVFDLSAVLPHEAMAGAPTGLPLVVGQLLRALVGYNSRPELVMLAAWAVYVGLVLTLYLRPIAPRRLPAPAVPLERVV
ncbi:MAG: FTR1 family iron permease [Candidatus Limnocylindrales bacterium]